MKRIGSIGIAIGFAGLIIAPVVTAETSANNQPGASVSSPQKSEATDARKPSNSQTISEQMRRSMRGEERREAEDDHSP
jgi:hypothetical protein